MHFHSAYTCKYSMPLGIAIHNLTLKKPNVYTIQSKLSANVAQKVNCIFFM